MNVLISKIIATQQDRKKIVRMPLLLKCILGNILDLRVL